MSEKFFQDLIEFLPKHVSPIPSYSHAIVAFLVTGTITYLISGKFAPDFDLDQDGEQSESESIAALSVRLAGVAILSLMVADFVFSFSWRRRNIKINRNHITYSRWFPSLYTNQVA
jgi:hypothetical protein